MKDVVCATARAPATAHAGFRPPPIIELHASINCPGIASPTRYLSPPPKQTQPARAAHAISAPTERHSAKSPPGRSP